MELLGSLPPPRAKFFGMCSEILVDSLLSVLPMYLREQAHSNWYIILEVTKDEGLSSWVSRTADLVPKSILSEAAI
jgi:hypothetical protein